jgi:hypothetical protein
MRKPIYHEQKHDFRIVPVQNDLWVVQRRTTEAKGHNAVTNRQHHFDPWKSLKRPTTMMRALEQMNIEAGTMSPNENLTRTRS